MATCVTFFGINEIGLSSIYVRSRGGGQEEEWTSETEFSNCFKRLLLTKY